MTCCKPTNWPCNYSEIVWVLNKNIWNPIAVCKLFIYSNLKLELFANDYFQMGIVTWNHIIACQNKPTSIKLQSKGRHDLKPCKSVHSADTLKSIGHSHVCDSDVQVGGVASSILPGFESKVFLFQDWLPY